MRAYFHLHGLRERDLRPRQAPQWGPDERDQIFHGREDARKHLYSLGTAPSRPSQWLSVECPACCCG